MYLACLYAENFRVFGSTPQKNGDTDASLSLEFGPATNVLVGENDSGKTAIIEPFPTWLRQGPGKAVLLRD